MSSRTYLSIGDVLTLLREEFPDVTISKIRFLESQGLVNPERSPSGYRKFFEADVERLRWVLRQQREHFLPLKVIRDRLDAGDLSEGAAGEPVAAGSVPRGRRRRVVRYRPDQRQGPGTDPCSGRCRSLRAQPLRQPRRDGHGVPDQGRTQEQSTQADDEAMATDTGRRISPGGAVLPRALVSMRRLQAVPDPGAPHAAGHTDILNVPREHDAAAQSERRLSASTEGLRADPDAPHCEKASDGGKDGGRRDREPWWPLAGGGTSNSRLRPVARCTGALPGSHDDGGPPAPGPPTAPTPAIAALIGGGIAAGGNRGRAVRRSAGASVAAAATAPGAGCAGAPGPRGASGAGGPSAGTDRGMVGRARAPRTSGQVEPGARVGRPGPGRRGPGRPGRPVIGPAAQRGRTRRRRRAWSTGASLTSEELCAASGLSEIELAGLQGFGLIDPVMVAGIATFDEDALTVANLAAEFRKYGIEARHLRPYRNAVDREMGRIEQVIIPLLRQRNPESCQRAVDAADELGALGQTMRATLLRTALRRHVGG